MNKESTYQANDTRDICTVSEINLRLKQTIANNFALVWVEGEISNLARPASGHIYFSLKDKNAQLRCVMFRRNNARVPFEISNGLQVVVRANASVYEARGDLQLIVDDMEEAGFGALQRQFEALKKKLFQQGILDEERKSLVPQFPTHIAIITSPSGAAIKDYLNVAQRRYPACKKSIYSVLVQGEQAAQQIISAIKAVNQQAEADIIVLIRGGGSIEDLWCFNDEQLAHIIADSDIPVVTGIGHEIDYTIADFVADLRAPTPSVAAELTCPDSESLLLSLSSIQQHLTRSIIELSQKLSQSTDWLSQRLQRNHPTEIIKSQRHTLDSLLDRIKRCMQASLKDSQYRLNSLRQRHYHQSPHNQIHLKKMDLTKFTQRLKQATNTHLDQRAHQLQICTATMQAISPLNTLQRGYSITTKSQQRKKVISDPKQLKAGDQITTHFAQGEVHSRVESTSSNTIIKSISEDDTSDK